VIERVKKENVFVVIPACIVFLGKVIATVDVYPKCCA
jgi:hypothetical protein